MHTQPPDLGSHNDKEQDEIHACINATYICRHIISHNEQNDLQDNMLTHREGIEGDTHLPYSAQQRLHLYSAVLLGQQHASCQSPSGTPQTAAYTNALGSEHNAGPKECTEDA